MALMPYAASGLLGSLASGESGSRNSTGLVPSITIRPFHPGKPPSAFSRSTHLIATKTISALAASSTVPALIDGPSSLTRSLNDSGPRRFAIVAEIPLLANNRATLEPRAPAPIIPILLIAPVDGWGLVDAGHQHPICCHPFTVGAKPM